MVASVSYVQFVEVSCVFVSVFILCLGFCGRFSVVCFYRALLLSFFCVGFVFSFKFFLVFLSRLVSVHRVLLRAFFSGLVSVVVFGLVLVLVFVSVFVFGIAPRVL